MLIGTLHDELLGWVAIDDRPGRIFDRGAVQAVDPDHFGPCGELLDRPPHREQRCLQDVQRVDLGHAAFGDGPGDGARADHDRELLAHRRGQELGIAQTANAPLGIENHRRRDHRSRQRSPACLVDAGDQHAIPARRNSIATASAAIDAVSAASDCAIAANSASSRRLTIVSS